MYQKFNWVCFKQQKSHIFTLKYNEFHIQAHLFQKVG